MLQTRQWWEEDRQQFELYTSEVVIDEAAQGDPEAAAERLALLSNLALLPILPEAATLADELVARHALPPKARIDAAHVAIAATNGVDFLLTWNCRQLANATLRAKIEEVCRHRGCRAPTICTPPQLREVQP